MADGSGAKITGNDFTLTLQDGNTMTIPWTLSNYMKMSGQSFPSRVRLYCVHMSFPHDGKQM